MASQANRHWTDCSPAYSGGKKDSQKLNNGVSVWRWYVTNITKNNYQFVKLCVTISFISCRTFDIRFWTHLILYQFICYLMVFHTDSWLYWTGNHNKNYTDIREHFYKMNRWRQRWNVVGIRFTWIISTNEDSGTRFSKGFSIVIQIRFTVTSILTKWSL